MARALEHPRRVVTRQQFAELALSLPETSEKSHFAQPDFRVCGKIFCGLDRADERGYMKLPQQAQALLTESRADAFSPANGAWGASGWTYVLLARVGLDELRELLTDAWREVAPKRLSAELPPPVRVFSIRAKPGSVSAPGRSAKGKPRRAGKKPG